MVDFSEYCRFSAKMAIRENFLHDLFRRTKFVIPEFRRVPSSIVINDTKSKPELILQPIGGNQHEHYHVTIRNYLLRVYTGRLIEQTLCSADWLFRFFELQKPRNQEGQK